MHLCDKNKCNEQIHKPTRMKGHRRELLEGAKVVPEAAKSEPAPVKKEEEKIMSTLSDMPTAGTECDLCNEAVASTCNCVQSIL